jgi:hypothetical protein
VTYESQPRLKCKLKNATLLSPVRKILHKIQVMSIRKVIKENWGLLNSWDVKIDKELCTKVSSCGPRKNKMVANAHVKLLQLAKIV